MSPYLEQSILAADPVELIRILYRHGVACIQDARQNLRWGNADQSARAIQRAAAVVGELSAALRPEAAPEMAERLASLYGYMQRRLRDAQSLADDAPLTEVLGLMTTLSEAWQFRPAAQPNAEGLAWQAAMAQPGQSSGIEFRG